MQNSFITLGLINVIQGNGIENIFPSELSNKQNYYMRNFNFFWLNYMCLFAHDIQ